VTSNAAPAPIHVVFALLPGSLVLDWAGPAEALRIANQVLARRRASPSGLCSTLSAPRPSL
jgi:transcriptional regulator GlxA family with amidase domain